MFATHTYGETPSEAIGAQVRKLDGGKFSMELNPSDLVCVTEALLAWAEQGGSDPNASQDRAQGLRLGILEVLGLEEL